MRIPKILRPAAGLLMSAVLVSLVSAATNWPIVTRRGDTLYEGDKPFRFFGLATPNLQQHESQILPDHSNRFPDEFETRDALDTLQRLGARATRTFSLSVATSADHGIPVYVTGRRTYNEDAFRCLDRVLALCHEYDVRIIVPIIASQSFATIRGVDEFAALSGKTETGAFWTDETVKEDFRHYLSFLANRRNTVNGILYRDEPALLGWQLGNEFDSFPGDRKLDSKTWEPRITAWSLEMAKYLKQVDPNHLMFEAGGDKQAMIDSPDIDVISTHLYEYWNRLAGRSTDLAAAARADRERCRGKKPLVVDEFGLATVAINRALMDEIRTDGIVGGLLWSLRVHRRDGGFFYHNEGGTPINSYHFPGFAVGHEYDETQLLDLLRVEAYAIRGETPPAVKIPTGAPILFAQPNGGFTWRGCTGAASYAIERAPSAEGPWTVMRTGIQDSVLANVKDYEASGASAPTMLWWDETAKPGDTYFYRVRGLNAGGATPYSAPVRVAVGEKPNQ